MISTKQLHFSEIINKNFDIFIVSSGFESRASYQASKYIGIAGQKIALGFSNENEDLNRIKNDVFFKENQFELVIIDGEDAKCNYLDEIVKKIIDLGDKNSKVNIYIDYSCMTKNWYAYLLYSVNFLKSRYPIILTFGYSHSKFVPYSEKITLNRVVMPLFGYCNLSVPSKPTALLIGMGNEPNRISGLKEYFDAILYLFYTDTTYNSEYSNEIENNSKEIIEQTNTENIFRYPVHDLTYTSLLLDNLCNVLLNDYRVIIAPCGPKPFSLISMIISLKYDNLIEVWRISPGHKLPKVNREATDLVTVLEVTFS
jgi:hypothetical protein